MGIAVITGSAGLIGSEAVTFFAGKGLDVVGIDNDMQLMPETQATFRVADPFDPVQNVATGTRFLKAMLVRFKDLRLALAAYNAGPETVARAGAVPTIPETVQYVQRIMTRYAMLQESHPGLASKGKSRDKAGKGRNRAVAGS